MELYNTSSNNHLLIKQLGWELYMLWKNIQLEEDKRKRMLLDVFMMYYKREKQFFGRSSEKDQYIRCMTSNLKDSTDHNIYKLQTLISQ